MGQAVQSPPAIFGVNWFRLDANKKFLWPGYGENLRVLKWVFERVTNPSGDNHNAAKIGYAPRREDLDLTGLDVSEERFAQLMKVDAGEWQQELASQTEFFDSIGATLPAEMRNRQKSIQAAFAASGETTVTTPAQPVNSK